MDGGSSASTSGRIWRSFNKTLLATTAGAITVVYLVVLIVDPYNSVPFSPDWERYPVTAHSRDYNAVLARKSQFDSAVIGNSTAMLLRPSELNTRFGGSFVMLAMPAASPYEQLKMVELFHRHHASIRILIMALDTLWCAPEGSPRFVGMMTENRFPASAYDSNPWNDLPPLNRKTLQHTRSQLLALAGIRVRYPHRPDGFRDFTLTLHPSNDIEEVRKRLYQGRREQLSGHRKEQNPSFPHLDELASSLEQLPPETTKISFFVPFHHYQHPVAGTEQEWHWNACKHKAARVLGQLPNSVVLDFLIPSWITNADENYIDGQHYTGAIASELVRLLFLGANGETAPNREFRILGPQMHGE